MLKDTLRYSEHALLRMFERKVTKEQVIDVICKGTKFICESGTVAFEKGNVRVILDSKELCVVTCYKSNKFDTSTGKYVFGKEKDLPSVNITKYGKLRTKTKKKARIAILRKNRGV